MPPYRPIEIRLMEKVDVRGPDECWPWLGACGGTGRPMIHVRLDADGKRVIEHAARVMYRIHHDEPGDRHVHHVCRNSMCVNPGHLRALSEGEHMAEHAVTSCLRGHEYTPENTRIDKRGYKNCRACSRERSREIRKDPVKGEARRAWERAYVRKRSLSGSAPNVSD